MSATGLKLQSTYLEPYCDLHLTKGGSRGGESLHPHPTRDGSRGLNHFTPEPTRGGSRGVNHFTYIPGVGLEGWITSPTYTTRGGSREDEFLHPHSTRAGTKGVNPCTQIPPAVDLEVVNHFSHIPSGDGSRGMNSCTHIPPGVDLEGEPLHPRAIRDGSRGVNPCIPCYFSKTRPAFLSPMDPPLIFNSTLNNIEVKEACSIKFE